MTPKIGVLALQGAFIEHERVLESLGARCVELRKRADLNPIDSFDGFVLPGGESTVQRKLLRELDMLEPLRDAIAQGAPVLATCAGLILLARKLERGEEVALGTLPVAVERNAYGRQLGSFQRRIKVGDCEDFNATFIRAPQIVEVSLDVRTLAVVDGKIVAVEYRNQIALAFHPELGGDSRIHQFFLARVAA
ncbi:MAG: pyridoxal 5'-phosphate synthase glutaminase subunit PdxT [Thermoguttaceae bacterium]|nr:pyridoxal 5'-phosphate synthase glutaminase subunit PdxT [Thermoguttaceae bacterium]